MHFKKVGWKNQTMGYNGTIMVNVLKLIQAHNCKGFPCSIEIRCSEVRISKELTCFLESILNNFFLGQVFVWTHDISWQI